MKKNTIKVKRKKNQSGSKANDLVYLRSIKYNILIF